MTDDIKQAYEWLEVVTEYYLTKGNKNAMPFPPRGYELGSFPEYGTDCPLTRGKFIRAVQLLQKICGGM